VLVNSNGEVRRKQKVEVIMYYDFASWSTNRVTSGLTIDWDFNTSGTMIEDTAPRSIDGKGGAY
jgi:hypothetical protein